MIDHNHFICHLILGTFTEYPFLAIRIRLYQSETIFHPDSAG
jgi:hypothetical protein